MTSRAGARRWLARWYVKIRLRGDGCEGVDTGPGETNGDIAPIDDDGDSKGRPRLDEWPDPLDEPQLEPREELPLWPEPLVEEVCNMSLSIAVGRVGIR